MRAVALRSFRGLFHDLYQYREVLYNLISQDLKIKYRRTMLGYVWSLLNPVIQLLVLSVVFSHVVRLGMKDYTLFLFSGLLAWTFFSQSLIAASTTFLDHENFIKKIYLPKLLFPLSKVALRGVDFVFSLIALSLVGVISGFPFYATWFYLPFAVLCLGLFTIGLTILVAIATVFFRDVKYLLGVFLQLLYFATPILYPMSVLPPHYAPWMRLNPFYSQVHLFQELIYHGQLPGLNELATTFCVALMTFALGLVALITWEDELVFRM